MLSDYWHVGAWIHSLPIDPMKLFLIPILHWIASLPWADFLRIVGAAGYAAGYWTKTPALTDAERDAVNASRATYVRRFISDRFPRINGNVLNVLLELAVFWFNRDGWNAFEKIKESLSIAQCGPRALALILEFEGIDQPWKRPPGQSGITIGVGFDLGYCTEDEFREAWERHLDSRSFLRLHSALGKTGSRAAVIERDMMGCQRITKEMAYEVFERCTLPKWKTLAAKTFPGLEVLTPDQQGALVSLVFNRGASLAGPRRREMANIRDILLNPTVKKKPSAIAQQFLNMRRLWPDIPGLQRRRTAEANLLTS